MNKLPKAIQEVRDSVAAVIRICDAKSKTNRFGQTVFSGSRYDHGSAFCVLEDRYLVTAHHVLNYDKRRDPNDVFRVIMVPSLDFHGQLFA